MSALPLVQRRPGISPRCRSRSSSACAAPGSTRRGRRTSPRRRPARSSRIRAGRHSCGRLSSRLSTARESCDSASTGTASSLAIAFSPWVIMADLQHPAFRPGAGRRPHQLQVVDHDQRQPLGPLQPPAAGAQRRQRDRRRVVDLDRQRRRSRALTCDELVEVALADVAAADAVAGDPRTPRSAGGWPAVRRSFPARRSPTVALRQRVRVRRPRLGQQRLGRAEGDLGGQRGLAHARAARRGSSGPTDAARPSWHPGRAGRWSGRRRGRRGGKRARPPAGSPRSARARR